MIYLGAILIVVGLLIRIAAVRSLGADFQKAIQEPSRIVTSGVYRHVRHPSYTGALLITTGLLLVQSELAILWLAYSFGLARATQEEHILLRFDEYRKYMKRTGRFIPRLKTWL